MATMTLPDFSAHQPGAVPMRLGIALADGMSQACLMLLAGISLPRDLNMELRCSICCGST